jgi:hypothetical protein
MSPWSHLRQFGDVRTTSALPLKADLSRREREIRFVPAISDHSRRLLDHLVGEREQRWRNCEAECPGRLQVDDQLELRRLFDG